MIGKKWLAEKWLAENMIHFISRGKLLYGSDGDQCVRKASSSKNVDVSTEFYESHDSKNRINSFMIFEYKMSYKRSNVYKEHKKEHKNYYNALNTNIRLKRQIILQPSVKEILQVSVNNAQGFNFSRAPNINISCTKY